MKKPWTNPYSGSLVLLLLVASGANAAVIYVNQAAGGATHDGTNWATAFVTIQEAVDSAKSGDEVWVAKGNYNAGANIFAKTLALFGGFAGTETARGQRDIRQNVTFIDRNGVGPGLSCDNNYVTISGFRLRNVGISAVKTTLRFLDNQMTGGGISLYEGKGIVMRNVITGGGGVDCTRSSLVLTDNTISGCGYGVFGDAFEYGGTGLIAGNTITGNQTGLDLGFRGVTVVNNIIAFNGTIGVIGNPGWTIMLTNDVYGNGWKDYEGIPDMTGQNGNISVDPRLTNIYHNVHLMPDSPCRDIADSDQLYSLYDVDGQLREQGSGVDLGSDESDGTLQVVPTNRWYVSTAGSDANAGTSWAAAKATIAAALLAARGGDEVWVKEGMYTETVTMPVGISLYGGFAGNETSLAQRDISAHPTTITWTARDRTIVWASMTGIRIDGFTIQGGREGVVLYGNSVLANCSVLQNNIGVFTGLGSVTLTDNFIADTSTDGVKIQNGNVTMTGNYIDWHSVNGISVLAGGYLKLSRNHVQRANVTGLYLEGSARVDADNNVFTYHNQAAIWANTGSEMNLRNNTIARGFSGTGVYINSATAHLTNNVIAFHPGYGLRVAGPSSSLTMNSNAVFGNGPDYDGVPPGTQAGNLSVDPLFVNFADWNFRLQPGSPLIDAGVDSVVVAGDLDLDGKPRITGAHVDIGAYEYTAPGLVTMQDVLGAARITGGLSAAAAADLTRWNVVDPGTPLIDLMDAVRLVRKVAGLDPNP